MTNNKLDKIILVFLAIQIIIELFVFVLISQFDFILTIGIPVFFLIILSKKVQSIGRPYKFAIIAFFALIILKFLTFVFHQMLILDYVISCLVLSLLALRIWKFGSNYN